MPSIALQRSIIVLFSQLINGSLIMWFSFERFLNIDANIAPWLLTPVGAILGATQLVVALVYDANVATSYGVLPALGVSTVIVLCSSGYGAIAEVTAARFGLVVTGLMGVLILLLWIVRECSECHSGPEPIAPAVGELVNVS